MHLYGLVISSTASTLVRISYRLPTPELSVEAAMETRPGEMLQLVAHVALILVLYTQPGYLRTRSTLLLSCCGILLESRCPTALRSDHGRPLAMP